MTLDSDMESINTIIFDIGNVLMSFDNMTYLQRLFQDSDTVQHVFDAIWGSGYWDELDLGEDKDMLLEKMVEHEPEYGEEIRAAVDHIEQCMSRREYPIPWIRELKRRGYKVLYLSNYSRYVTEAKPEVLDFLPEMDGGIFSCNVHLIKPDPEIYYKLIEAYDLIPENCVFIDDREINVEAAKAIGMKGIVFQTYRQVKEELECVLRLHSNQTISYYNRHAGAFIKDTQLVEFSSVQDAFLKCLKPGAFILDFGCGSGRDTKYFLEKGYQVEAIDGSEAMCAIAAAYTGLDVKPMYFQELSAEEEYDGIWACSSILHLPWEELEDVFGKMLRALKPQGTIYTSFKYGDFEGIRSDRYFTDMTEARFAHFLANFKHVTLIKSWVTDDVRPGRDNEKWLNLLLKKTTS